MTACSKWKSKLLDYEEPEFGAIPVYAEQDVAEKKRVAEFVRLEAHLKICTGCAATLADLRARAARLDAALPKIAGRAELIGGFEARFFLQNAARISTGNKLGNSTNYDATWRSRRPMPLAEMLAVCAIALVAMIWPAAKKTWLVSKEPSASISTWRSPTGSLLQTPGVELLRTGPKIGEVYFRVEQGSSGAKE